MKCEEALLLISGHLDLENTPQEEAALEAHLAECEDCRRLLADLQAADAGLADLTVPAPEGFADRVMEQVRAKASPRRKHAKWVAMGGLAAAVVLVMGIGYYTLPGGQSAQDASPEAAVPMMVRTLGEEDAACSGEAPAAADPADLARQLGAPVVVLDGFVEELEGCGSEVLDDGSLLYLLETAETAAQLGRQYGAMVYDPGAAAEVSFAVVK